LLLLLLLLLLPLLLLTMMIMMISQLVTMEFFGTQFLTSIRISGFGSPNAATTGITQTATTIGPGPRPPRLETLKLPLLHHLPTKHIKATTNTARGNKGLLRLTSSHQKNLPSSSSSSCSSSSSSASLSRESGTKIASP
jgi:hypothetical protein